MLQLIAAHAHNNVIGNNGLIPWNLPEDQQRFKKLTLGSVIIMGRRSFEEIFKKFGHALPGRETIVLSKSREFCGENYRTAGRLREALEIAGADFADRDVFICGGESIYREALKENLVEKMYLTEIDLEVPGDAFFPDFYKNDFKEESREQVEGKLPFSYVTYTRK